MDNLKTETSYLTDWVFHYNSFGETWAAIPRDTYTEYWNDYSHPKVLRSKKIETLLTLLHKSKGNINVIEDIVSGKNK
jgi:hypothetical protein